MRTQPPPVLRFALVFPLLLSPAVAQPSRTLHVAPSGANGTDCLNPAAPCRTISAALLNSSPGDTLSVANGVYAESIRFDKSITLAGGKSARVVLDGSRTSRPVEIVAGASVVISGITIRNGLAKPSNRPNGGGVLVNSGCELRLSSVVVESNLAESPGFVSSAPRAGGGGVANFGKLRMRNADCVASKQAKGER